MTGRDEPAAVRTYGFLLLPGFAMMSYASALEPLRAANRLAGRPLYAWRHLSVDGGPVPASNGATLAADGGLAGAEAGLDAVLVCAGGNPAEFDEPAVLGWLRAAARRGLVVGGVSAGPYVLAKAGVLDGYRATVHWEHAAAFAEAFPRVALQATLFEIDRRRLTCAGGVAALDMMHRIIGEDHGYELARSVSDWFLQAHIRPGSGGQRLSPRERLGVRNPKLAAAVEAMERRIEEPLGRREVAAAAGVSTRQLDRLFAAHLGTSLERHYLAVRLERARELLGQTDLSVTAVAVATGFASVSHFSRAFSRRFGSSPRGARR